MEKKQKILRILFLLSMINTCPWYNKCTAIDTIYNDNKNIMGASTTEVTKYAIDLYYLNDTVFIYDRGEYNTNTGKIETTVPEKSQDKYGITNDMVEKDATAKDINKWYGFDGINNRLIVVNRSNADVLMSACANNSSEVGGKTSLELLKGGSGSSPIDEINSTQDFNDDKDIISRFGAGEPLASTEKIIINRAPEDINGTVNYQKIFFNITGEPNRDFGGSAQSANIGTVTLNFSK